MRLTTAQFLRSTSRKYCNLRGSHTSSRLRNMAASALPETLKSITAIKIQELTRQREAFESRKAAIYRDVSKEKDAIPSTQALLDGITKLRNIRTLDADSSDDDEYQTAGPAAYSLRNHKVLLRQATRDPSFPLATVTKIKKSFEKELELESLRHSHGRFFSELVTEWLNNPDSEAQSSETNSFENIGRKEMHEQRATWESMVFNKAEVDVTSIEAYLKQLFEGSKTGKSVREDVVKRTKTFCSELMGETGPFEPDTLSGTMTGLLQTDLLSEEKSATLRTFMHNKEVLKEVADVLNMRYASLSSWNWTIPGEGIPVEMRRQLNGKYRVFMDEDILDALILYEIGLKWSVHFKNTFATVLASFFWKKPEEVLTKKDRERREFYLHNDADARSDTVQSTRQLIYQRDYFLTQLPVDEHMGKRNYDDDDGDNDETSVSKSPLELKHGLLHMLVAEGLIAKEVRSSVRHTVIRSDFKWFGPGLPHDTIYTVLKYFGVTDTWLDFFRKYLEVQLSFIQDGLNAQARIRKRGVPMSHTLSDMFGEVVLFVMDVAVNQATSSYLYRLHDDFWLWGPEDTCLKGWKSMTQFASIMGIEFNEEKTGTVRFGASDSNDASDSEMSDNDSSIYKPDTTSLPPELKLQLSYCQSIFSYVQSYNAYVGKFFTNNFGKPSYGFGRDHVDMMISAFARIQKELFPSGSVTDHLSSLAAQRFNMNNLPQGFWYFPVEQGGVELRNPLIPLLGMRESLRLTPERMMQKTKDREEFEYLQAERIFKDNGGVSGFGRHKPSVYGEIFESGESFMPRDEYFRYREERSQHLGVLYRRFMQVPAEEKMRPTEELNSLLLKGNPELPIGNGKKSGIFSNLGQLQPYWLWILALHGKEIVEKYGSVRMVDGGKVPLGIVSLMKKGKVRWRG